MKVLLIDDEEISCFISRRVLENVGKSINIRAYKKGQEALRFILANKFYAETLPDFILLDISMPTMNGWEFLEKYEALVPILKKKPQIWMLSSTMHPVEIDRIKSHPLIDGFISKPFDRTHALDLLNRYQR